MKQNIIIISLIACSIVGGWLIGQEVNDVPAEEPAKDSSEKNESEYSQRLREALERRRAATKEAPPTEETKSPASRVEQSNTTKAKTSKFPEIKIDEDRQKALLEKRRQEILNAQKEGRVPQGVSRIKSDSADNAINPQQKTSTGLTTDPTTDLSQNSTTGQTLGQLDTTDNLPPADGNIPAEEVELFSMTPPPDAPDTPFDLVNVLDYYSEVSGLMPIRRASVNNDPQIYINFKDLDREEAMEYLEYALSINGISIMKRGDKFFQATEVADAPKIGAKIVDSAGQEFTRLFGSFVQATVKVKYIPTDIAKTVLDPLASQGNENSAVTEIPTNNMLILRDNEPNVRMMLEMLEKVDVNVPLEVELELIPIRYALADEIASVLGTLTPSGAATTGSRSSSNSRFGSGRSNSRNSSSRSTLGNTSRGGLSNTTNPSQNRNAFQNRLQNIVSRAAAGDFQILGDTKILPDERTNSILVFANKRDMAMIKQIISKLDVVQAQVLIEAVIMEVSLGENLDTGISIVNRNSNGVGGNITDPGLSDTLLSPGQFAADGSLVPGLPGGFSYFSAIGSDINAAIRALASDRKVSVLQRPRIQTFHAREASIMVGESRPFVGGTFFGGNFGGVGGGASSSQIQYQDISVELHVLPLINQEGLVVLEIEQIVKDLNGFETIDGNRIPVVANRQAVASVAVQDGQTIILGGMITTNKSVSKSGVPVLKDVPVLGSLFSNKTESENQVELIVLIKPKVMPTPEIAKDVAADELDKLIITQQAKMDIEQARAKIAEEFKRKNKNLNDKDNF